MDGSTVFTAHQGFILNPDWTEEKAEEECKYFDHDGNGWEPFEDPPSDQLFPEDTDFKACRHCNLPKEEHTYEGGGT